MSNNKRVLSLMAGIAGFAVVLSGCGTASEVPDAVESPSAVVSPVASATPSEVESSPTVAAPTITVDDIKVSTDEIPTVGFTPTDQGVTELLKKTIVEGPEGGMTVSSLDDTVNVNYVGYGLTTGIAFDGNFGQPGIEFQLGSLIPGWGEGLQGAKVGDRVLLIIPADKAYGSAPPTSRILPNETLIFVLDINTVTSAVASASASASASVSESASASTPAQ